jgi:hypothetical protein
VSEGRSTWQIVRKRVLPVVMVVLITMLVVDTCRREAAEIELRLELGDQAALVESVEADLFSTEAAAPLAHFRQMSSPPPVVTWRTAVEPGVYRLEVRVRTAARTVRIQRQIEARARARITVPLEEALRAPPPRTPPQAGEGEQGLGPRVPPHEGSAGDIEPAVR